MDVVDYYFLFVNSLAGLPWPTILFFLKGLSLIVIGVALWWYFSTVAKLRSLYASMPVPDTGVSTRAIVDEIVAKPWIEIQQKISSPNPADWGLAVMQADAVLDKILKASGYIGDTMADRLRQINSAELESIEDVWRAHKIRNRLAHGTEGHITRGEADLAIRSYEKAFRELNYI